MFKSGTQDCKEEAGHCVSVEMARALAGATAGTASAIVGYPVDCVKVRMQICQFQLHQRCGVASVVRNMFANEGIASFYRGILAPISVRFIIGAAFFTINGKLKDIYSQYYCSLPTTKNQTNDGNVILPVSSIALIAGMSGASLTPLMCPNELVKTQMQSRWQSHRSLQHCVCAVVKNRVVFRGYVSTTARLFLLWSGYVCGYEAFNRVWDRHSTLGQNHVCESWLTSARVLLGSTISGAIGWTLCFPFDTVKTITHSQSLEEKSASIGRVVADTYRHRGVGGFYRGLTPTLIGGIGMNAVFLWVYEFSFGYLHNRQLSD